MLAMYEADPRRYETGADSSYDCIYPALCLMF
jgi:hypothetical protein